MAMRASLGMVACASVLMLTTNAMAQDQPWWTGAPEAPAQAAPQAPAQQSQAAPQAPAQQAPVPQAPPSEPPPGVAPEAQVPGEPAQVQSPPAPAPQVSAERASQGEGVYTAQYGWAWVPYGSTTTTLREEPYAYLYTPSFGWRWVVSPWGARCWPHGWAGGHYAPFVRGGAVHFAPRAYAPRFGGAIRVAPRFYGGG